MAEKGYFFNSIEGDPREYQAEDFANYFNKFIPTGVFNTGQGLYVSADGTSLNTIVGTGAAFIDGYMYENDSPLSLEHAIADPTYDRIDLVVIRLDTNYGVRNIYAVVKQGTPGASPVAPTLTDDGYIKEIPLAEVRIKAGQSYIEQSQITDKRGNLIDTFGKVIEEYGSNANGEYVKLSNGWVICYTHHFTEGNGTTGAYKMEITFPAALMAGWNAVIQVTAYNDHNGADVNYGTAETLGIIRDGSTGTIGAKFVNNVPSGKTVHLYTTVIGRWK